MKEEPNVRCGKYLNNDLTAIVFLPEDGTVNLTVSTRVGDELLT